ncbi:redoxin domain-containing protein [Geofilum sp. OHC36d9]|uniref:redoxin domain-containing protein n=1 Tax=Geofilum sp. OHC36d9 TaxID=3458413 RepID=UPI004033F9CE
MKKLLLGLAFIGLMASCSTNSYKINGTLEDGVSGKVFLKKIAMQGVEEVDTADVVEGKFAFEGSAEYPELYLLFFEDQKKPFAFFLENGTISITGKSDSLDEAKIEGSKMADLFAKFNDDVPHQDKVESMRNEFMTAQQNGDQATMQSLMADMQTIIQEQQDYYRDFVKANSTNAVGAFLALNMAQALSYDELDSLLTSLKTNLGDHPYVAQLEQIMEPMKAQQEAEAKLAIGEAAPGFTLTDINGKEVTLESLRGKYVLLDFWASWCRPCRMENPNLVKAYEQFGGDNFEIVSISLDKAEEDWKKAVEEDKLSWTLLHDADGAIANNYAVQSIPSTWLLDKEGVIIEKQLRGEELATKLDSLLGAK